MKKKLTQNQILRNEANERLISAAKNNGAEVVAEYGNTLKGFNETKVEEMRDLYGANAVSGNKPASVFKRFVTSFINPFTIVLIILAVISLLTDVVFAGADEPNPTSAIIVLVMVILSGILRFVQETRSGKAAEELKAMINVTTCVQRQRLEEYEDGEEKPEEDVYVSEKIEIPLSEVVAGDIVYLAAGDMVPADVRILTSKDLFVSQSSLTGESHPLEKIGAVQTFSHSNPLELNNLAFMGSNVVSGSATCVAVATGDSTSFGSIAKTLTEKKVMTSFEKGVRSVSLLLIGFMLIMVPVVFLVVGLRQKDWLSALMFGLSIAVGLTPEMLPMIVTTNLAKGATKMAKQKTIIKNLNSIQNFGSMDVLCTDKTGTITQDKVVLERYLNINGEPDDRILRHAFLNSYYQTGLKNLMDIAILNHIKDKNMGDLTSKYIKVDEIPFDFNRRRMSVVIKDGNGKTQLITKGAVEEMLSVCAFAEYQGKVETLTDAIRKKIMATVDNLSDEGMRVLAIAQKTNPSSVETFSVKDESEMVLLGYLAFLDPPKKTSAGAIKALKTFGVSVKVLTGDGANVTQSICKQVGLDVDSILLGTDIESMTEEELSKAVESTTVFAKLSPQQKVKIVHALRKNGHVVGFMGDGINDASAMREADVGISVDTAVDIAKESADIILLEKDLMVLERGVIEGRKTFANIIKYIKMTASSNFGNMFAVLFASIFLPFIPMLPTQILVLNLIYDISCISIPWDNVDSDYIRIPRKWDASSIRRFMLWIGPTSSIFDIATYLLLFFVICPNAVGSKFGVIDPVAGLTADQIRFIAIFQAGWFIESLWSQTLVIHMIRTPKIPFIKSRASWPVIGFTTLAIAIGTVIPFTIVGESLKMASPGLTYFGWLVGIIAAYMILTTLWKLAYIKRYKELL